MKTLPVVVPVALLLRPVVGLQPAVVEALEWVESAHRHRRRRTP